MESATNWRLKIALLCYFLCVLFALTFSAIYLFRTEFMPYHAAAVEQGWAEVMPAYQLLFLSLMKAAGGGWLSISIAVCILLFGPFRQGVRWTFWAIPAIGLPALVVNLYITINVTLKTPGNPPWELNAIGIILLIVGFVLSITTDAKSGTKVEEY